MEPTDLDLRVDELSTGETADIGSRSLDNVPDGVERNDDAVRFGTSESAQNNGGLDVSRLLCDSTSLAWDCRLTRQRAWPSTVYRRR